MNLYKKTIIIKNMYIQIFCDFYARKNEKPKKISAIWKTVNCLINYQFVKFFFKVFFTQVLKLKLERFLKEYRYTEKLEKFELVRTAHQWMLLYSTFVNEHVFR